MHKQIVPRPEKTVANINKQDALKDTLNEAITIFDIKITIF